MDRKVVEFRLDPDDISAIRFGVSPGHEMCHAVRALANPQRHPLLWGWLRSTSRDVPRSAYELLRLVIGDEGYMPDFLTSQPAWDLTPELELERLRAADPDTMRIDLGKRIDRTDGAGRDALVRMRDDLPRTRQVVADAWEGLWAAAIAPSWSSITRMLDADITARARRMGHHGVRAMVDDLDDAVTWRGDTVTVQMSHHSEVLDCRGSGLVLVPSVMSRRCAVLTEPPAQPTLFYPALGVSETWSVDGGHRDAALGALLGRTRADLLVRLAQPSTTSESAELLGLAVSTASHHLSILRDAGLVDSRRSGGAVVHARTPLGDALVRDDETG